MITSFDEYPVHQVAEPIRHAQTSDRNFYDRYYFNAFDRDGEQFIVVGFGQYPNLGVHDAFAVVSRGDLHRVVRSSAELVDRADTTIGPLGDHQRNLQLRPHPHRAGRSPPRLKPSPEAQALGLAEADPSMDVDGHDAAAKSSSSPIEASVRGLSPEPFSRARHPRAVAACRRRSWRPWASEYATSRARHASGTRFDCGGAVLAHLHLLANVEEEYNAVYCFVPIRGRSQLLRQGRGGLPTATALLGDLIDLGARQLRAMADAHAHRARRPAVPTALSPHFRPASSWPAATRREPPSSVRLHGSEPRSANGQVHLLFHLGFLTSPVTDSEFEKAIDSITRLGRVEEILVLGSRRRDHQQVKSTRRCVRRGARRSKPWGDGPGSLIAPSRRQHPHERPSLFLTFAESDAAPARRAVPRSQGGKRRRRSSYSSVKAVGRSFPSSTLAHGTTAGAQLITRVRGSESARAAIVADCGMQATALTFDALMTPGAHAICMRQVYNKTRTYLERVAGSAGGSVTIVDDGDYDGIAAAIEKNTALIFGRDVRHDSAGARARPTTPQ